MNKVKLSCPKLYVFDEINDILIKYKILLGWNPKAPGC